MRIAGQPKLTLFIVITIFAVWFVPHVPWMILALGIQFPIHYFIFGRLMGARRWWLLLAAQFVVFTFILIVSIVGVVLDRLI